MFPLKNKRSGKYKKDAVKDGICPHCGEVRSVFKGYVGGQYVPIFGLFGPHPAYQQKYIADCQQKRPQCGEIPYFTAFIAFLLRLFFNGNI